MTKKYGNYKVTFENGIVRLFKKSMGDFVLAEDTMSERTWKDKARRDEFVMSWIELAEEELAMLIEDAIYEFGRV